MYRMQKHMIAHNDIEDIDISYFDILEKKDYGIVLRSHATGHYWYLLEQVYNQHRSFQIYHKHNKKDPYHLQTNRPSVASCCEYIQSHDSFHLRRLEKKEQHRQKKFI